MRLSILSNMPKFNRGFNDFFPFYKWRREFLAVGWHVDVFVDHNKALRSNGDIIIVSNRYFRNPKFDTSFIYQYLENLRAKYSRVVWFDAADTSGVADFNVIPHVDLFLKKQVLKDRSLYLLNSKDRSVRVWLKEPVSDERYSNYVPCPADQLHKLRAGWNIGLCDYRRFPGYTGVIRNYLFWAPSAHKVRIERPIDIGFRGQHDYKNPDISRQRNDLLRELNNLKRNKPEFNILLGEKVGYSSYLRELRTSKLAVSPFGWGEVCYRDFESVLAGAILIKPNMDHIETFPNIFIDGSYVSINWDMQDLARQVNDYLDTYEERLEIAERAQLLYYEYLKNSNHFVNHVIRSLTD